MIVVENLTKRFGERDAVHDISFNVERGEILGFLGPNGAGKTTTMRILTCYFPPSSGRAEVAGFDVMKDSIEVRKRTGYMPENVPLYMDMPVEAYLGFVADVKGVPARERRKQIDEVIDETSLTEYRDYPIGKISRGFRQRVGLAQAIIGRPDVLILDEPTVGLDPRQIKEIRSLIRNLASRATVILSTHIMQEVEALCNRVIIIDRGTIREIDTPANLRSRMAQSTTVEVVIGGGDPSKVTEVLGKITGVNGVRPLDKENEATRYLLEIARDIDVRATVASTVVRAEWSLLELKRASVSLEDVFMHVVSQPQPDEPDEDEAESESAEAAAAKEDT
jgi:ABC-2 type transport system ATP-binding protein